MILSVMSDKITGFLLGSFVPDSVKEFFSMFIEGIGEIIEFLYKLPSFILSLIDVIPSPFNEIIVVFISLIISYFILKAIMIIIEF